jgi:hypothetical protein
MERNNSLDTTRAGAKATYDYKSFSIRPGYALVYLLRQLLHFGCFVNRIIS